MFFVKSIPGGIDLTALRDGFLALCQNHPALAAVLVFALGSLSVFSTQPCNGQAARNG
jgi:hypothetical protein